MKKVFFVLITLLLPVIGFAQKPGYRDIRIGQNLDSVMAQGKYKFLEGNDKFTGLPYVNKQEGTYYLNPDTLKICGMPIRTFVIRVDSSNRIVTIFIGTGDINYADYAPWLADYRHMQSSFFDLYGKAGWYDDSKNVKSHKVNIWEFPAERIELKTNVLDVYPTEKNFTRNFIFSWHIVPQARDN